MFTLARGVDRLFEAAVVLLFLALLSAGVLQITNRFVFNASLAWTEEFQKYAHVWLVYLAIPVAYRRAAHIGVDLLHNFLPRAPRRILTLIIDVCWLVLAGFIVVMALRVMRVAAFQTTPGLGVSMASVYAGMVVGGGYLAFVVVRKVVLEALHPTEAGGQG